MAARLNKWQFYVYEILNNEDNVIYVGKGVNNRIVKSQYARKGASSRIVAMFKNEKDAFLYEVERIAMYEGLLNANKGGFGGCVRKSVRKPAKTKDQILIEKIGTKAFAARMLLNYYLVYRKITSKVDEKTKHLVSLYTEELITIFERLDIKKLAEVGYGSRA